MQALARIKAQREANPRDPCKVQRAYWCPFHKGWHLTKQELKRRRLASDVLMD